MQYCIVSLFVAFAFMFSATPPLWGHDPVGDTFYIATAKKSQIRQRKLDEQGEPLKKININTGTLNEIAQLVGVGTVVADRVIRHREKNGPFKRPEDITKVPGINKNVYEMNKDKIIVK